jgi:hypothetical protein
MQPKRKKVLRWDEATFDEFNHMLEHPEEYEDPDAPTPPESPECPS